MFSHGGGRALNAMWTAAGEGVSRCQILLLSVSIPEVV